MTQKRKVSTSKGRCISFGDYKVRLTKDCQLEYYYKETLTRCKDVGTDYDEVSLYEHVKTLAIAKGFKEIDLKACTFK